jgi:hypothetical protein
MENTFGNWTLGSLSPFLCTFLQLGINFALGAQNVLYDKKNTFGPINASPFRNPFLCLFQARVLNRKW